MSPIRLPLPSPLFPAQSPPSPVRASRSDFFRAALDGVAMSADAPAARPAASLNPTRASDDRPQRPGALLDIRV